MTFPYNWQIMVHLMVMPLLVFVIVEIYLNVKQCFLLKRWTVNDGYRNCNVSKMSLANTHSHTHTHANETEVPGDFCRRLIAFYRANKIVEHLFPLLCFFLFRFSTNVTNWAFRYAS